MKQQLLKILNPILHFHRKKIAKMSHQRLDLDRMRRKWALLEAELQGEPGSFLDVGCNEGFFSRYTSELGWFSMGIDTDRVAIEYAVDSTRDRCNVVFAVAPLSRDLVNTLPRFDVIAMLSSFQEIYVALGREEALYCLGVMLDKCNSKLLFEPASTNEKFHDEIFKKDNDEKAVTDWVVSLIENYPEWHVRKVGKTCYSDTEPYRYLYAIERKFKKVD